MNSKRIIFGTAAVLVASVALVGCSGTNTTPGGNSGSASTSSPAANASFNMADVQFVAMMLPHHKPAVAMSDAILAKTDINPAITALAQQIKAEQQPEIDTMNSWLKKWNVDMTSMTDSGMGGMGGMNGMMSDSDMTKLDSATGVEASRLFLEGMTTHHSGAIDMAETEIKNGKDPDAIALAKSIKTAQTAEIATMKDLLAQL